MESKHEPRGANGIEKIRRKPGTEGAGVCMCGFASVGGRRIYRDLARSVAKGILIEILPFAS